MWTGSAGDVNFIDIFGFNDDGLVAEHWGISDMMAMMQQLGVLPEDGPV